LLQWHSLRNIKDYWTTFQTFCHIQHEVKHQKKTQNLELAHTQLETALLFVGKQSGYTIQEN